MLFRQSIDSRASLSVTSSISTKEDTFVSVCLQDILRHRVKSIGVLQVNLFEVISSFDGDPEFLKLSLLPHMGSLYSTHG
jgi:hypothetical protein